MGVLEEGIVPCWLDLQFLQLWAGTIPLGYLNEAKSMSSPLGVVRVNRVLQDTSGHREGRKVLVENPLYKMYFDDPLRLEINQLVDFGWVMNDVMYRGATLTLGPRPGRYITEEAANELSFGSTTYVEKKYPLKRDTDYHRFGSTQKPWKLPLCIDNGNFIFDIILN